MKKIFLTLIILAFCNFNLSASIKIKKQGSAEQLYINGKPMLILGGELSNSAVTSIPDIDSVMPKMKKIGLNTVFVPVYWCLMETEENRYDDSLTDEVIRQARKNDLKVIFLWFGAWKNSMSCYAPLWFKEDIKRFPRAMTENGKQMEIATAFSKNVVNADKKAFCHLIQHIKNIDETENTVIMIQVENEIGMLESARDHCPLAEKTYMADKVKWKNDEDFQAHYYATYVEELAKAGKNIYSIPMYVNAAMNSRGRKPGEYPSAGPLAHLIGIWKAAAPDIDIYAPDIYDTGFKNWVGKYKQQNNPFFTPETRLGRYSGVRALYCFGEVDAMGFSPFAIDQATEDITMHVTKAYDIIRQLTPLLLKNQGQAKYTGRDSSGISKWSGTKNWGILFNHKDKERIISDHDLIITCRHYYTLPWDPRANNKNTWPEGGGLIIKLAEDEYIIAGSGIVITFQTRAEKQQTQNIKRGEDGFTTNDKDSEFMNGNKYYGKRIGLGYVNQVKFDKNGNMQFIRQDNGDQDHQGRHARISCDNYEILHIKLYKY